MFKLLHAVHWYFAYFADLVLVEREFFLLAVIVLTQIRIVLLQREIRVHFILEPFDRVVLLASFAATRAQERVRLVVVPETVDD